MFNHGLAADSHRGVNRLRQLLSRMAELAALEGAQESVRRRLWLRFSLLGSPRKPWFGANFPG